MNHRAFYVNTRGIVVEGYASYYESTRKSEATNACIRILNWMQRHAQW